MSAKSFRTGRAWVKWVGAGLAAALLMTGVASAATTYTYDGQGRVVQVVYDNGVTITYAYDAAGNRTTVSITSPSLPLWGSFTWGGANWH